MKIKIEELKKLCLSILAKRGLLEKEALEIFNEYLDAELRGRECHGFQFFPNFGAKLVDSTARKPKIIREEDNLLFIDGQKNLGQIVCNKYVPGLIKKAKNKGIAMMGIYNMHSYLMPGTYARMAAENNLVGFVFNYGGRPRIAPTGSIDPILGTNPIAIGIPNDGLPIVVDMATAKIAMGKVRLTEKLGRSLPENVTIDKNGRPTTDPIEAMAGAILPFGDHRGSALALVIEILTKTMFNVDIHNKTKANRGFFFIFFDPSIFQPIEEFKNNVSKLVKEIKNSRKAEGVIEIFYPGEKSEKIKRENLKKDYLDLEEKIIENIKNLL
ncbi:MAG: Ldh family oxidoreductase [Patescibacteria group bacterium]|nr:Ldh family oxidoreductase [Patescibacteria group bacterium]MDD5554288.1 Ldh family oxidoreductase [Patescibacteria group bacterium]